MDNFVDVQNELSALDRERELSITGFPYHRQDITREHLIENYGTDLVESIDESHREDWLELMNHYDHRFFVENYQHIPMGLEKKISIGWFMHFFSWMQMDAYSVEIEGASFHGNWLDVPFPYADEITLYRIKRDLPDPCYNWYELFVIINDMMWEQGRCLDIGITGVRMDNNQKRVIVVDWSS